jgi:hypothetical protein
MRLGLGQRLFLGVERIVLRKKARPKREKVPMTVRRARIGPTFSFRQLFMSDTHPSGCLRYFKRCKWLAIIEKNHTTLVCPLISSVTVQHIRGLHMLVVL